MRSIRARRTNSQSSYKGIESDASPRGISAATTAAIFPPGSTTSPETPTVLEDVDEGDDEEDELQDDGMCSSSSDEDDVAGAALQSMAKVGIQESHLEDQENITVIEQNKSQIAPGPISPALLLENTDTGKKHSLTTDTPQSSEKVRGESATSTITAASITSSDSKPSYFDLRPSASRKRQEAKASAGTPLGTPGGYLTPSAATSGATTPGGRPRRPTFRKGKHKMTDYNFNNEKDILGIVILEVQGAEDLPRLKNGGCLVIRSKMERVD